MDNYEGNGRGTYIMATIQNARDIILQAAATRFVATTLPSNVTVAWTDISSKPTDAQILNAQAVTNANLVRSLASWTLGGTSTRNASSPWTEDHNTLVIPIGETVASYSPTMALFSGSFSVSFRAWGSVAGRILHVDFFPDTLPEATISLTTAPTDYTVVFTSSHADMASCVLRFFADNNIAGQCEVGNIKVEYSSTRTMWTPHRLDLLGAANKLSSGNISYYMEVGSIYANYLNVANLAAITANLGTITSGDITGTSNLYVSGYVKVSGTSLSGVTYAGNYGETAGYFVTNGAAGNASVWDIGVWGQVNGTGTAAGKIGVIGIADQANGFGVVGASSSGTGIYALSAGGKALDIAGNMYISSSALVVNLNANYIEGVSLSGLVRRNQVDIEYSLDNGSTWAAIRFR